MVPVKECPSMRTSGRNIPESHCRKVAGCTSARGEVVACRAVILHPCCLSNSIEA